MNKRWYRLAVLLVALLVGQSAIGWQAFAGTSGRPPLTLANEFLQVSIDPGSGRFAMQTKAGSPLKASDNNKPLLFEDGHPDTSFTTFRINGKDLIYGNGYGFLGMSGRFASLPATAGTSNQSVWEAEGLQITQTITIVEDRTNPNAGNVKVSYRVVNKANRSISVGSRILLDTMLGPVDASPVSLAGSNAYIRTETAIAGPLPYYWKATDNPINPKVMAYGFLQGWGNKAPDRMVVAHWNGISETKWDYTPDPQLDFTNASANRYGSADSAVAMYWEPAALAPGAETTFETFYGLGSFFTSQQEATYRLQLAAPKQLTLNAARDGYAERQFEIRVEIDNAIDRSVPLHGVNATIGLPPELELADGERNVKPVGDIPVGGSRTASWQVKAKPQFAYRAAPYQVVVQAAGGEESIQASFVVLPALSGKLPDMQLLEALPGKLYMNDANKSLMLQGKGFDVLNGTSDWTISLIRDRDGAEIAIPKSDVTIASDKLATVLLRDSLGPPSLQEPGTYRIRLDAGVYGKMEKKIELTTDTRYQARSYGILLVVGDRISPQRTGGGEIGQETYRLVAVESEAQLRQLKEQYAKSSYTDDKVALLEIRGAIRSIPGDDPMYEIGPGATINAAVHFEASKELAALFGQASQKMVIQQNKRDLKHAGDFITLTGNGVLSIPGFPFAFGPFGIELADGTRYAFEPDEDAGEKPIEINWDVLKGLSLMQHMGFFSVEIRKARLGKESLSFGGKVAMKFDPGAKDKEEGNSGGGNDKEEDDSGSGKDQEADRSGDKFKLSLDLDEARYGIRQQTDLFGKAGTFGFLGLRAEGEAGLPDGMVPGLDLGANGRVLLDTFNRKFEIEANVKFKVVEVNGLLTLRFTESGVPIPDNFLFVVGGEPGIPLIPTTPVAYITKGGGGFRNMYDTLMGNFNLLPPLKLVLVGGMSIAKVVSADNVTVGLSMRGVEFSGEFEIAKFPILKEVSGSIQLADSLTRFGVALRAGAKLNILDVVTGDVYVVFEYDSSRSGLFGPIYMAGGGSLDVSIPKAVPLVGGLKLASAQGEISTEKVFGKVTVIGIPVGFEYVWGDTMPKLAMAAAAPIGLPESAGLMEQTVYGDDGSVSGAFRFGTNLTPLAGSHSSPGAAKGRVATLSASRDYAVPMPAQREKALLELRYSGDTPPQLTVTDPSGRDYPLVSGVDGNYLVQEIAAEDSQSGVLEQRVYVSFQQPAAGTWTVHSDRELEWTLHDVAVPPTVADVSVAQTAAHALHVTWDAQHAAGAQVSLLLVSSDPHDPGLLLAESLDAADGATDIALPDTIPSGTYAIRAVLSQGGANVDSRVSDETFTLVNPYQPAAPAQATALPAGNGLLRVSWEAPQAADGYTLQLLDATGKAVADTGTIDVAGDARQATVGGLMHDASGHPVGLAPGASYRVSIGAFKEVDGKRVYGEPAVTAAVYVPQPQPAALQLTAFGRDGKPVANTYGDGSGTVYVVGANSFGLRLHADQPVSSVVSVNGNEFGTFAGDDWLQTIPLQEGTNQITVFATNETGDTTLTGIRVVSDTIAPDLKIESPGPAYRTTEQTVVVKGKAEPGSKVTVDGTPVALAADGGFEQPVAIGGTLTKRIDVRAADDAGNETAYAATVLNGGVDAFERVVIRPAGSPAATEPAAGAFELVAGTTQQLDLYGIDAAGNAYAIDPSRAEWSVLYGEPYGTVSANGVVTAEDAGELVVKASYAIAEGYSLEHTFVVRVVSPDGEAPRDHYGDWYVPSVPSSGGDPSGPSQGGGATAGGSHGSESGGSTDPKPSGGGPTVEEAVEQTLRGILQRLIESENGVGFMASAPLAGDKETVLIAGDRAVIRIPPQPQLQGAGIGVGAVRDARGYETDGRHVVGRIYEIKLDKPARLSGEAELIIRFALEEIPDLDQAAVYWYDERRKRWDYVGGAIDPASGTIRVKLPHLSKYALLYDERMKRFADMRGRWSQDSVKRLASLGAVDGVERGDAAYFEPERSITRQEFLKIAVGISGAEAVSGAAADEALAAFADRGRIAAWAAPYMAAAVRGQWLNGSERDGGLYAEPEAPITRAEAIAFIGRIAAASVPPIAGAAGGRRFADDADVPEWARGYVDALASAGIVDGYPDGTLRPNGTITREEAAAMLSRMLSAAQP